MDHKDKYTWNIRVSECSKYMLYATLEKVDPAFGEIVKAARYKRISSAFYPPDADNNPMPGDYHT